MSLYKVSLTCAFISVGLFAASYLVNKDFRSYLPSFLVKNEDQNKEEEKKENKKEERLQEENKKIGFGTSDR